MSRGTLGVAVGVGALVAIIAIVFSSVNTGRLVGGVKSDLASAASGMEKSNGIMKADLNRSISSKVGKEDPAIQYDVAEFTNVTVTEDAVVSGTLAVAPSDGAPVFEVRSVTDASGWSARLLGEFEVDELTVGSKAQVGSLESLGDATAQNFVAGGGAFKASSNGALVAKGGATLGTALNGSFGKFELQMNKSGFWFDFANRMNAANESPIFRVSEESETPGTYSLRANVIKANEITALKGEFKIRNVALSATRLASQTDLMAALDSENPLPKGDMFGTPENWLFYVGKAGDMRATSGKLGTLDVASGKFLVADNGATTSGELTVNGGATVNGLLTANDGATVHNGATVNGLLTANDGATVHNGATVNGALTANDGATIHNGATVNGALTANNGATIHNGATVNGALAANGGATVNGALAANGGAKVEGGLTISTGSLTAGSGKFVVDTDGHTTISADARITKTLAVDSTITAGALDSEFITSRELIVNGLMTVGGPTTFKVDDKTGDVNASGDLRMDGDIHGRTFYGNVEGADGTVDTKNVTSRSITVETPAKVAVCVIDATGLKMSNGHSLTADDLTADTLSARTASFVAVNDDLHVTGDIDVAGLTATGTVKAKTLNGTSAVQLNGVDLRLTDAGTITVLDGDSSVVSGALPFAIAGATVTPMSDPGTDTWWIDWSGDAFTVHRNGTTGDLVFSYTAVGR